MPRPSPLTIAAALLAPLLVLGPPLAWWARPDPPATLSPLAQRMDRTVQKGARVVLLGASKVTTDLDHGLLATAFGVAPKEVAPLNVYGSTAGVWYSVLEERVYGNGIEPDVILVYSTFDWTLASAPSSDQERAVILGQLGPDEEVVRRKFLGVGFGGVTADRVRRRRTEDHTRAMAWVRNAAVGVTLAPDGEGDAATRGAALSGPALTALFEGVEGNAASAVPIVEQRRSVAASAADLDATLLPDFLSLAAAHHAKILFINAPVRRGAAASHDVSPELLRAAVERINAAGAGYVDLRDLNLGDAVFGDSLHMNRAGRATATRVLVDRLRAMGAVGDGPIAAAEVPVLVRPPEVHRTGVAPTLTAGGPPVRTDSVCGWEIPFAGLPSLDDSYLAKFGLGGFSPLALLEDGKPLTGHAGRPQFANTCAGAFNHLAKAVRFSPTGDVNAPQSRTYTLALSEDLPLTSPLGAEGWWVYPGTTLEFAVPDGHPGGPDYALSLQGLAFGGGKGAPTVTVGETTAPIPADRVHRDLRLTPPAPTGPWQVRVSSPADGPYLLLTRLSHGTPADRRYLLGEATKQLNVLAGTLTFAKPPPDDRLTLTPGKGREFTVEGVPDSAVQYQLVSVSGCSPLRVFEDGKPRPPLYTRKMDVDAAPDRDALVRQTLFIRPADDSEPTTNGRTYTVALDPTRACGSRRWLYPGDAGSFEIEASQLATLPGPVTRVELGGAAIEDPSTTKAEGTLRIRAGDQVFLDARFPLATLVQSPPSWTPDTPIPRDTKLTVELAIPADAPYTLLTSLTLTAAE